MRNQKLDGSWRRPLSLQRPGTMFATRLTGFRCVAAATGLAGLEAPRSIDESRAMTPACHILISKTMSGAACAPTEPVCFASPGRQGWNAGARELPEAAFRFSHKMTATGFNGDSQKLLMDAVKDVREKTGVNYAKIGQCNEDQLHKRQRDSSTYPAHIHNIEGMKILMHGVLGRHGGRSFGSTGAKANDKLQDVRLNQQLEPIEMVNHLCAGTLARPIAIYMMPVLEEFDGRSAQLAEDVARHNRACLDAKRKDPTDMQQEGEDDETHKKRLKLLHSQRVSDSMSGKTKADVPVSEKSKPDVAKPPQVRKMSMELFDSRKNKLLGGWSATPSPSEHRAQVESRYLIGAIQKQLGPDEAALRLNETTGPYSFHTILNKLNITDSGLSGFPAYANGKRAAALHQAAKDRWLCKPTAHSSSGSGSASE